MITQSIFFTDSASRIRGRLLRAGVHLWRWAGVADDLQVAEARWGFVIELRYRRGLGEIEIDISGNRQRLACFGRFVKDPDVAVGHELVQCLHEARFVHASFLRQLGDRASTIYGQEKQTKIPGETDSAVYYLVYTL